MTTREIEEALNENMAPYLKAEREGSADSSPFWSALGNGYQGLGKKPKAVWAYQKALKGNPWNKDTQAKLKTLQKELKVPFDLPVLPPESLFYQVFAVSLLLALFIRRFFWVRMASFAVSILVLVWLGVQIWFLPAHGIIMSESDLTQLPTPFSPKVSEAPLLPGLKVKVLSYEEEGTWLKIQDPSGKIGFVPFNVIKVI
ncbi:MAG: hypothetical protein KDK62_07565 [Chlamydiia bacterium]|nr:hypothetical protein [Chlamydiia bacterium]